MIKRTLGEVKEELRRVAGTAGMKANDTRLIDCINIAQERLLSRVKTVAGSIRRVKFAQFGGVVALPPEFERIISGSVNRHSVPVVGQWYEFMDYGPQQQDSTTSPRLVFIDHGEAPVIRQSTDKARYVRAYSYADERIATVRPCIRVFGYDENDQWVRTQNADGTYSDGEALVLNGDLQNNWSQSVSKFYRVTHVSKPVTQERVELYFYDDQNDQTYFAGRYFYKDTTPSFRLYQVPALPDTGSVIHLLVKVRFSKVTNDSDPLLIGSIPALRYALRAIAKEDGDEYVAAEDLWELSSKTLRDEAREYYGASYPLIDVKHGAPVYGGIQPIL